MLSTCKLWTGARLHNYGQASTGGLAHRAIYEQVKGPIPDGMLVMHTCDTPLCVNPEHLILGTKKSNYEDAKSKGRHTHGTKSGHSNLTEDDIRAIRASSESTGHLSIKYGVSAMNISYIKRRITWRHVL